MLSDVCPSVCHTPVFCRNGSTYHPTFLLSSSHIINSSFWSSKRYGNIPTGTPVTGRQMQGVWKTCDFVPISRYISETMQDTAIVAVAMECE